MYPFGILWESPAVERVLQRRGQVIASQGDRSQTLWPFDAVPDQGHPTPYYKEHIAWFGEKTYRKMLRRLARAGRSLTSLDDLGKIAGAKASEYVERLASLGVVEMVAGGVRLARHIDNIGPSLEFYVAVVCMEELGGTAIWGVKLEGLPAGGDYDVLASLPPVLVYVELKTSEPAAVKDDELRCFLQRSEELSPDLAILLIDTDRPLDNVVGRLNEIMRPLFEKAYWQDMFGGYWQPPLFFLVRDPFPGVNFGYFRTYVINSHPLILTQLRRCLQHYYARAQHLPSRQPVLDFLKGEVVQAPFGGSLRPY